MERTKSDVMYEVSKKTTYFYKESVVYPFVQARTHKNGFIITNEELCEILAFVENSGMSRILILLVYLDFSAHVNHKSMLKLHAFTNHCTSFALFLNQKKLNNP